MTVHDVKYMMHNMATSCKTSLFSANGETAVVTSILVSRFHAMGM